MDWFNKLKDGIKEMITSVSPDKIVSDYEKKQEAIQKLAEHLEKEYSRNEEEKPVTAATSFRPDSIKEPDNAQTVEDAVKGKKQKYFGEEFLKSYQKTLPNVNEIILYFDNEAKVWCAASVNEVDKELRRVRCGERWHEDFVRYMYNEELLGTARKAKDLSKLEWGDLVWVCDNLNDEPDLAVFLGFFETNHTELKWLTISRDTCLEYFNKEKTPPFGSWKYMWMAEKENDLD